VLCGCVLGLMVMYSTAHAEQAYFAFRGGMEHRVDAESAVKAASVRGGARHFAAYFASVRRDMPRQAAVRDMTPSRCAS